jgi:hypothetical protein
MGEAEAGGVLPLAGDIVAASAALAGLLIVYLGGVASEYASFAKTAQASVRGSFQSRAWFAVGGVLFSVFACGSAALAKWQASPLVAGVSLFLFACTLFWSALSAVFIALRLWQRFWLTLDVLGESI